MFGQKHMCDRIAPYSEPIVGAIPYGIDWLDAASNLGTIAAAFIGVYTLIRALRQIKAQTLYNISKDSRDLVISMHNTNRPLSREEHVGILCNLYHSVYQQRKFGTLDRSQWGPFEEELKILVTEDGFQTYWTLEKQQLFSHDYVQLINKTLKKA
jgi:hypothetical protein